MCHSHPYGFSFLLHNHKSYDFQNYGLI
jgi:hypothetical protein